MLNPAWTIVTVAVGGISWALLRRRRSGWAWVTATLFVGACLLGAADLEREGAAIPPRWILLDTSDSCAGARSQWRRWAERALADLPPDGRAGLILVGARPRVAIPLTDPETLRAGLRAALAHPPEGDASALGAALTLASRSGPGADVLLVSDGRPSDDLEAGAQAVRAAGGRVFAFAPDLAPPRGAWVADLAGPARVPRGSPAALRLSLGAWERTSCRLELGPRDGPVWRRWELTVGPEPTLIEASTPPLEGPLEVEARLTVNGPDAPTDNRRRLRIGIEGQPQALVVGASLALPGCDAQSVSPDALPAALDEHPWELIALHDLEARRLAPAVPALRRAVERGAALIVLGAGRAFGQGGYAESALEGLLPVTSGPGTERGDPLSAAFVVDASGSMLQGGRFAAAVEAFPWSALRPDDALLPLAFADAPQTLGAWTTAHAAAAEALRAHAQGAAGGGTDVGAALLAGLEQLAPRAGQRALVLVTDSLDPDPERHVVALRAQALDPASWSVLLVRIGAEDDRALRRLAEALGPAARVLAVETADAALREALAGELAAGRASLRRGEFALRPTPEGAAAGLSAAIVRAYAATRARPSARVLARAVDPELDDPPLVATWSVGSGTVGALPLRGPDAGRALAPLLGGLLPASQGLDLVARRRGPELRVTVRGARPPQAELVLDSADAPSRRWLLPPGEHELTLTAPDVACELRVEAGGTPLAQAVVPAPGEVARAQADPRRLAGLAARHGGRLVAALPTELPPREDAAPHSLAGVWAALALAALLLEVGGGVRLTRRALRQLPGVELLDD
ncbi:MAG: VWA domain-containing protein [Planctomycetota bacterium]